MYDSMYLKRFNKLRAGNPKGQLTGELVLLELIKLDEEDRGERKTAGGIIVANSSHARSNYNMLRMELGIVLELGSGFYDPDTGKDIPLDLEVGNVVWVQPASLGLFTTVPGIKEAIMEMNLALTTYSQIKKIWPDIAGYYKDRELLNE